MAMPGSGSQTGHTSRQRLRPWLIDQINSGKYSGLSWLHGYDMAFKISWKHFGKPGVVEERDAKIFREWARHTGKYKDGDQSDPSTWKTRFRCALYKLQDIEELHDLNMLDGDEPYRVYRFKSKDEMDQESRNPTVEINTPCISGSGGGEEELILPISDLDDIGIDDTFLDDIDTAFGYNPATSVPVNLQVQLFFKTREIGDPILVHNPTGCRVAYGMPPQLPDGLANEGNADVVSHIFGPFHAQQVYYPDAEDEDTQRLLRFMKRGLVLQTNDNDIYATRLCQAKIYFCSSPSGEAEPIELRREQTTKVFDYQSQFQPQLNFALGGAARPPRPELYFSFGQRWGSGQSLSQNMVYACITHLLADQQIKMLFNPKLEVLVSEPNPLDQIATQIDALNLNGPTH